MKFRKIFLIMLVVSAAVCSTTCFASEETQRAVVEEMLALTDVDKLIDSMFGQLEGTLQNQFPK